MTDFGDYFEEQITDYLAGGAQFDTPPTDLYVGLHTGAPSDDGSDNEISTTSTGYQRVGTAVPGDWNQPSTDKMANAAEVKFAKATSDWGDVSHFSLWDAQSGGNCLIVADLNTTRTILTDDESRFAAGELTATFD